MKLVAQTPRRDTLRANVQHSERRLDAAVARLGFISTEELSLVGRMSRDPWGWVAGACLLGLVIGVSRPPPVARP